MYVFFPANAAYLAADHHVYIVMNILSVSILLVIVPYIPLYRTMKPATQQQQQQQQRTGEPLAEIELNFLLNNEELVSSGDNGEKELVSLKDGDWCVERGLEKEEEGGRRWGEDESDKTQLLGNIEVSSDEEEEEHRL